MRRRCSCGYVPKRHGRWSPIPPRTLEAGARLLQAIIEGV